MPTSPSDRTDLPACWLRRAAQARPDQSARRIKGAGALPATALVDGATHGPSGDDVRCQSLGRDCGQGASPGSAAALQSLRRGSTDAAGRSAWHVGIYTAVSGSNFIRRGRRRAVARHQSDRGRIPPARRRRSCSTRNVSGSNGAIRTYAKEGRPCRSAG